MQVVDKIGRMIESGKMVLFTGDIEALEINVANKKIDLNIEDKDFLKRVRKIMSEFGRGPQGAKESEERGKGKKKSSGALSAARTVAETLDRVGITLTLSYKGGVVVTLGSEANPTLLQLITKTRTIAINNLFKLIQMIV